MLAESTPQLLKRLQREALKNRKRLWQLQMQVNTLSAFIKRHYLKTKPS